MQFCFFFNGTRKVITKVSGLIIDLSNGLLFSAFWSLYGGVASLKVINTTSLIDDIRLEIKAAMNGVSAQYRTINDSSWWKSRIKRVLCEMGAIFVKCWQKTEMAVMFEPF